MKAFRWALTLVLLLVALLAGLVIGAFNNGEVTIDLLVTSFTMKLGSVIVVTLFAGLLVGALLVLAGVGLPLYSRLRTANRQLAGRAAGSVVPPQPTTSSPTNGI
ncbi:MAG: lipopolysaccharide assembly protein LapA domain-containing protein [Pseudomonas sp.]